MSIAIGLCACAFLLALSLYLLILGVDKLVEVVRACDYHILWRCDNNMEK